MKILNLGSIGKNLTLLVMLAVLPGLAIMLYSGMEQRSQSIENAQNDVQLMTKSMAEFQKNLEISSRQTLSTLSLLSEIQNLDVPASQKILSAVLDRNPDFQNITLTDANGAVLASGIPSKAINLRDRKHVREALENKTFAVGEYIVTRVGMKKAAFAFAYPVLDREGQPKGVLTLAISLDSFSRIHEVSPDTEQSFMAITDHQGIRLYYYPSNEETNPLGKPIHPSSWERASRSKESGKFISDGSDGVTRIFAFQPIRLQPDSPPYIYVWAGIPEAYILHPANKTMTRNMLLMGLVMVFALFISWSLGSQMVVVPIENLVSMVQKFARGELEFRHEYADDPDEFETLTEAFFDMAEALTISQELLRGNEARFRLIMDSLDAFVYVADMDTYEVLFINEYGKKKVGDIAGKTCWQNIQEGQAGPCDFCTNQRLLNQDGSPKATHTWEYQNPTSKEWFIIHDRAIKWIDGRIVRLEIATDISEMKTAEADLAQEKERLAVTLRSIGDGVITTDTAGKIVLINAIAEQVTGWKSADAIGLPLPEVFNIVHEDTEAVCENPVDRVMSSGERISLERDTVLITKTGQRKHIADSGAPIKNMDSETIGVVLVFRDITEQIQTEKELAKVKKLESIGVLAGGIAHDFNNILAAILGNIDLSLLDKSLSSETTMLLKEAEQASYRAKSLTGQLLTFAKGGEPIIETASLSEIVKDSADFLLRGEKIACHYAFDENLGLVDIDKGQISQVVQNIILNAREAMTGSGNIWVTGKNVDFLTDENAALLDQPPYVKLKIKDSGPGMKPDILEKLFDPFFSTKKNGSGLGLAITHSIINKHHGHIGVQSSPGEGTSFSIYLPASSQKLIQKRPKKETPQNVRKAKIMLMDDEVSIREVIGIMLRRLGHTVLAVESGDEVLKAYSQAMDEGVPFDLVIMDLTIPGGMGGRKTIEKLLVIDPQVLAIVSSGYSNDPVMANFQDHGFAAAIVKPYLLKELSDTINKLIV